MSPTAHAQAPRSWTRDGFFVSTDPSLIPMEALSKAFASEQLYWTSALPESVLQEMLDNSLSFGLYSPTSAPPPSADKDDEAAFDPAETLHEIAGHVKPESGSRRPSEQQQQVPDQDQPSLIGFARFVTDQVTFCWLTDVYVLPEWQGQGLAKWMLSCAQEVVEDMPHLRRTACIIGHGREGSMKLYGKHMKMEPVKDPVMVLVC